jgi:hypothetical protein
MSKKIQFKVVVHPNFISRFTIICEERGRRDLSPDLSRWSRKKSQRLKIRLKPFLDYFPFRSHPFSVLIRLETMLMHHVRFAHIAFMIGHLLVPPSIRDTTLPPFPGTDRNRYLFKYRVSPELSKYPSSIASTVFLFSI